MLIIIGHFLAPNLGNISKQSGLKILNALRLVQVIALPHQIKNNTQISLDVQSYADIICSSIRSFARSDLMKFRFCNFFSSLQSQLKIGQYLSHFDQSSDQQADDHNDNFRFGEPAQEFCKLFSYFVASSMDTMKMSG